MESHDKIKMSPIYSLNKEIAFEKIFGISGTPYVQHPR